MGEYRRIMMVLRVFWKLGVAAFLLLVLALSACQNKIIFPAHLVNASDQVNPSKITNLSVLHLNEEHGASDFPPTWILSPKNPQASPSPAIIIAHGNAEIIDHWLGVAQEFSNQGFVVLLQEYPGYRQSTGTPSQKSIAHVMDLAYDRLARRPDVDSTRIYGFARSIGTGVICDLSLRRPLAKLVLISPFLSLPQLAYERFLPGFILTSTFHNQRALSQFQGSLFIVHGKNDEIIPAQHALKLVRSFPSSQKVELLLTEDHHNDLIPLSWENIKPALLQFFHAEL